MKPVASFLSRHPRLKASVNLVLNALLFVALLAYWALPLSQFLLALGVALFICFIAHILGIDLDNRPWSYLTAKGKASSNAERATPNPSIERTSPGKPGAASHVKR